MKVDANAFNPRRAMLIAGICGVLCIGGAYAAGDGCDDERNDRISPELALCSVHVYNIGQAENQTGSEKQLMKDVVALKTTVITQQMNKQYEYMEAMIRRFKTQLEKAILTTKLQAAGAAPSSDAGDGSAGGGHSGGSGVATGGRPNRGLANAEDCENMYTTYHDVYQCLMRNIPKIQTAVTAGDLGTARRQLAKDWGALKTYNRLTLSCAPGQQNCRESEPCKSALNEEDSAGKKTACTIAQSSGSRRDDIMQCLGKMRACVMANSDDYANSTRQQQRPY